VRKFLAGVVVGFGAGVVVLAVDLLLSAIGGGVGANPLQLVELRTYDWRLTQTARPETARTDIALVEIDEYTLRNLEPYVGRWPWPRVVHSMLIDYLALAPARVIGYDVDFAGPDTNKEFEFGGRRWSGAESDNELANSVRRAGNVVLLADATYEAAAGSSPPYLRSEFNVSGAGVLERRVVFPPPEALANAGLSLGHNCFVLDPDGPLRHTIPFVRTGDRTLPSFGLAAAFRVAAVRPEEVRLDREVLHVRDRAIPLSWHRVRTTGGTVAYLWSLIDFRGPAWLPGLKTRPYPHYSAFAIMNSANQILNHEKPDIDPSVFRNKIVFVGATGAGLHDVFETPFAGGMMPGIQVHAAVADDFLSNRFIRPAPDAVRIAFVLAGALAIGVVATLLPAWWATAVSVAALCGFAWIATRAFASGAWVNLSQPVLASAFALFGGVAYQYFVEGREKRKVKKLFGQYVSKDVFDQLVSDPTLARLGGQRREMTVLFSDIRGFTTVSERGQPEEVVQMLNEYFTRMVHLVFLHKGTVDKFVGDMVMALFGAPLDDPRHADHAVEAALDMIDELQALNAGWQAGGRPPLDIGIGINSGPMIAGNIGSDQIMSYTVIGDAVNLGSRLESLNKQYGTRIIISEATRERLTGRYECRPLGDVVVKGKTQAVAIFEVVGRMAADPAKNRRG
jgi:adenylate cyclase